jgi:hypothetical protein
MRPLRLLAAVLLFPSSVLAASCPNPEAMTIQVHGTCLDKGMSVGYQNSGSAKLVCLESNALHNACGTDGSLARRHAFSDWFNRVKEYEGDCESRGGTFAYADPGFHEPYDESFCMTANPTVETNMLEDTLCNYRSDCPPTPVTCMFKCPSL